MTYEINIGKAVNRFISMDARSLIRSGWEPRNDRVTGEHRRMSIWIGVNIIGLLAYLYFASQLWADPGEADLEGGPGDPFIWFLTAFPALAICSSINLSCSAVVLIDFRTRLIPRLLVLVMIIAAWVGANRYDFAHQYTGYSDKHYSAP